MPPGNLTGSAASRPSGSLAHRDLLWKTTLPLVKPVPSEDVPPLLCQPAVIHHEEGVASLPPASHHQLVSHRLEQTLWGRKVWFLDISIWVWVQDF